MARRKQPAARLQGECERWNRVKEQALLAALDVVEPPSCTPGEGDLPQQDNITVIPTRPRSKHVSQRRWDRYERVFGVKLEKVKQWKKARGRFPKNNKNDKEEQSMYNWMREYMLGNRQWTKERWEALNEAFGYGWEKEFCPRGAAHVQLSRDWGEMTLKMS